MNFITSIVFFFFTVLFSKEFFSYDLEIIIVFLLLITIWLLYNILSESISISLNIEINDIWQKFLEASVKELKVISKFINLWSNFKIVDKELLEIFLNIEKTIFLFISKNIDKSLIYLRIFFNNGLFNLILSNHLFLKSKDFFNYNIALWQFKIIKGYLINTKINSFPLFKISSFSLKQLSNYYIKLLIILNFKLNIPFNYLIFSKIKN